MRDYFDAGENIDVDPVLSESEDEFPYESEVNAEFFVGEAVRQILSRLALLK